MTNASESATNAASPWKAPDVAAMPPGEGPEAAFPASYADADGFASRSSHLIEGLAAADLSRWRSGYFEAAGDAGRYLPLHAMAKLLRDPQDATARRYLNDARSPTEHFHFAAANWSRLLPMFGAALSDATRAQFSEQASRFAGYLYPRGTENQRVMWWSSANVLPHYLDGAFGLSKRGRETTLRAAQDLLRDYVLGLYAVGQGEWDSSAHLMFDLNGMLNVYDFAKDAESRLLARAALDWYAATYALKYRDGVFAGPKQRGFTDRSHGSVADQTGYLWWGSSRAASLTANDMLSWRYALHAATSSWRPNRIISSLAAKRSEALPVSQTGTKPNYWHGLAQRPRAGAYHESLYIGRHITMGSIWDGHGGQMTRFQIVTEATNGAICFTAGHPRKSGHTLTKGGVGRTDGIGRYDQLAQYGSTAVILTRIPSDEPVQHAFFSLPEGAEVVRTGDHFLIRAGKGYITVTPFGGAAEVGESVLSTQERRDNERRAARGAPVRHAPMRVIINRGVNIGFVVRVGDVSQYASAGAFLEAFKTTSLDASSLQDTGEMTCTGLDLQHFRVRFNPDPEGDSHGTRAAQVWINSRRVSFDDWAPYSGPLVSLKDRVLRVSDGDEAFEIDCRSGTPVYRAVVSPESAAASADE